MAHLPQIYFCTSGLHLLPTFFGLCHAAFLIHSVWFIYQFPFFFVDFQIRISWNFYILYWFIMIYMDNPQYMCEISIHFWFTHSFFVASTQGPRAQGAQGRPLTLRGATKSRCKASLKWYSCTPLLLGEFFEGNLLRFPWEIAGKWLGVNCFKRLHSSYYNLEYDHHCHWVTGTILCYDLLVGWENNSKSGAATEMTRIL